MSDNPRQKGKTQKHFFCFFFLLLSKTFFFWKQKHGIPPKTTFIMKILCFCFLVSGFWYLTLDWLLVFFTNSTTCKAPTESQLFSSSYAAAYIILNRIKKESVSEATTWRTRSSALPPQPTHKVKEFFARHCKSIWSMLFVGHLALSGPFFFFFSLFLVSFVISFFLISLVAFLLGVVVY